MTIRNRAALLRGTMTGAVASVLAATSFGAAAQAAVRVQIAQQDLGTALLVFSRQSRQQILFSPDLVRGKTARALSGQMDVEAALAELLKGSDLSYRITASGAYLIVALPQATAEQEAVPGDIVVTARKREESIQDVPVAITAVTQAELTTRQVTGGPDLITQVPNMTFTKTNFTGYSIQIRGIGTQAVSATVDPAVSVAFNNTPFIRNRFFEQEFYDLERIEILRGPQGTLYGRNATAGVVNLISAKPGWEPAAKASVDAGSYKQIRLEGMVNVPLVEDKLALRIAGAYTKRDGYAKNSLTGKQIDGRDLFSTRVSLRFQPTDRLDANLVWEHFQEDDDRLRSGKQLCKTDNLTEVAGIPIINRAVVVPGLYFSQGCKPASLYSDESFGTPNGESLPYYFPLSILGLPTTRTDPYASRRQSTDLRTIESSYEPKYRARANIYELQLGYELNDNLRLVSETAYNTDFTFGTQDFNRFNTAPDAFYVPSTADLGYRPGLYQPGVRIVRQNGDPATSAIICDSQIGCSDRLIGIDLATARTHQFSQEFRVTSNNEGAFNFNAGVNFLRYRTEDKYYVIFNTLNAIALTSPTNENGFGFGEILGPYVPGRTDNQECLVNGLRPPAPGGIENALGCTYVDPNPIDKLNDLGHNYFLSKNPYRLSSYSAFGEGYLDLSDRLKLTVGARLTLDRKVAPQIPSWVLADNSAGYPVSEVVRQRWLKPTGKISLDWKPVLSFTDDTLLYGAISRGYKAGGANPPRAGITIYGIADDLGSLAASASASRPKTFKAEYVNAFEIGTKNQLFDRKVTVNLAAFYYDYKNYQVSQIVDRAAVNLNFDTKIWGAEAETSWQAADFLSLGVKFGYQRTKLGKGSQAIDTIDRTAGVPGWTLVRPFPTLTANCIVPDYVVQGSSQGPTGNAPLIVPGGLDVGLGNPGACEFAYLFGFDPATALPYVPNPTVGAGGSFFGRGLMPGYIGFDPRTAPNNGEGFFKNLAGNELPNAPRFTGTANADLSLPLGGDWIGTLHGDYYYQAKQWARVFNTPGYDRIRGYANVNAALLLNNKPGGWQIMAYVKNVFDKTAITGAFLNSDDTGLSTNIFLTEPRRYGLRVIKDFESLPFGLGDAGEPHAFGIPYTLTIEGGVQVQRQQAAVAPYAPSFAAPFARVDDYTSIQRHRHLPWYNGTDIAATLALDNGWQVRGRVRYGKVGGKLQQGRRDERETICGYTTAEQCDPAGPYSFAIQSITQRFADVLYTPKGSHTVIDFAIGRDVMLGKRIASTARFGLRAARLQSTDELNVAGIPDKGLADGVIVNGFDPFYRYSTKVTGRYGFRGYGPVGQFGGTRQLFGRPSTGIVGLDWEASGGVLFGKRRSRVDGEEQARTYIGEPGSQAAFNVINGGRNGSSQLPTPSSTAITPITRSRTDTATVPTLGGSLGLSYTLGRVALKGGYAYDRYFGAVRSTTGGGYDRTIHGPYLKLAFGFGR